MWAPVYDSTVTFFEGTEGSLAIGHLSEPRFEPEILLHFKSSPAGAERRPVTVTDRTGVSVMSIPVTCSSVPMGMMTASFRRVTDGWKVVRYVRAPPTAGAGA